MSFTIKGKELKRLKDWLMNHECRPPRIYDNHYPYITYRFTGTGMGIAVYVDCSWCGKEQKISDTIVG